MERNELVEKPFEMDVSLAVVKNLGSKLYSSTVAVLSEIIANAYDADAEKVIVTVDYENKEITIKDDGSGMSEKVIRELYLNIGGERRVYFNSDTSDIKGRPLMGRKGIGKLSAFALSKEFSITTSDGTTGFTLDFNYDLILDAISSGDKYKPSYSVDDSFSKGTLIKIKGINKNITNIDLLKQKVSRNFPIIAYCDDFIIEINGENLEFSHSNQYEKLQFSWKINDYVIDERYEKNIQEKFSVESKIDIKGWVGTVSKPSDLKDVGDENSSNNAIKLFINGKVADYNLLDQVQLIEQTYKHYLCGDIHYDSLDEEDVVISNREKVDRENIKVKELLHWLTEFIENEIAKNWSDLRKRHAIQKIAETNPEIISWADNNLEKRDRKVFNKIIESAYSIAQDNKKNQKELIKQGLISFQVLKSNDLLEQVEDWTYAEIDKIFAVLKDFEEVDKIWHYQDAKKKLEIINKLDDITDIKEKEKVVHQLIFENLWLVDPAWSNINSIETKTERAFKSALAEDGYSIFPSNEPRDLFSDEQIAKYDSRFDIKVLNNSSGLNTIIELKRPGRIIEIKDDLYSQLSKYNQLANRHYKENFKLVLLISEITKNNLPEEAKNAISTFNVNVQTYEEVISNALSRYDEYLRLSSANKDFKELFDIIDND